MTAWRSFRFALRQQVHKRNIDEIPVLALAMLADQTGLRKLPQIAGCRLPGDFQIALDELDACVRVEEKVFSRSLRC